MWGESRDRVWGIAGQLRLTTLPAYLTCQPASLPTYIVRAL